MLERFIINTKYKVIVSNTTVCGCVRHYYYDASFNCCLATLCAVSSIFSANIAYPFVGSSTNTCVTAPTNLLFCMTGDPDTSVSI